MTIDRKWKIAFAEGLLLSLMIFLAAYPFLLAIPYELRHGELYRQPGGADAAFDSFLNFATAGASAVVILILLAYGFARRDKPINQTAVAFVTAYGLFALMRLQLVEFWGQGTQPYLEPIVLVAVLGLIALGQWIQGEAKQTSGKKKTK